MKKITYKLILLLAFTSVIYGQSKDEMINRGMNYIYNLKFDSSEVIFRNMINNDRNDPTGYFFIAMQEWWRINVNKDDESYDKKYFDAVEKAIEVSDARIDINKNDDWALFLKGGLLGYRGFMMSMRENWLKAADDAREGLALIERSYEINPNNKDAVFGIGLYNYGVDHVFETNPFLKTLLFFFKKGNKQLGISQIKDCAENGTFSKVEANFVLAYINLIYEKNFQESMVYSIKLNQMYPDNSVFHKYVARNYVGQARWNEALNIWKDIMSKIDQGVNGYNNKSMKRETHYYLGLVSQRVNSNDEAIVNYTKSLELSRELDKKGDSPYRVFATLGIGMVYEQMGNKSEAVNWYNKVLDMKDYDNSRNTAQGYINNISNR